MHIQEGDVSLPARGPRWLGGAEARMIGRLPTTRAVEPSVSKIGYLTPDAPVVDLPAYR